MSILSTFIGILFVVWGLRDYVRELCFGNGDNTEPLWVSLMPIIAGTIIILGSWPS